MAASLSVAYTATPLAAGTKLIIEATRGVSAGINFLPRSEYKVVKISASAQASPVAILTEYVAIYGVLVSGQKIFVRATPILANGQKGATMNTTVVVT